MAIWSPLTTNWAVNIGDSSPRGGYKVESIGHHHVAGTSKAAALAAFAPGGREVTPNYFIAGREIWGIVPEDRRAWTSGSHQDDARAITYEILNATGAPNWEFLAETLDTVARLDADIARRYGIPLKHGLPGFWEHRNIYEWFRRGYATACAGPSFSINWMINKTASLMNNTPDTGQKELDAMKRAMYYTEGGIQYVIIGEPTSGWAYEYTTRDSQFNNRMANLFQTGNYESVDKSIYNAYKRSLEAVRNGGAAQIQVEGSAIADAAKSGAEAGTKAGLSSLTLKAQ